MGTEILVLSEDSGQGFETIAALLTRLLVMYGDKGEPQVTLIPAEGRMVREAAHANLWRSAAQRDYGRRVSLWKTIATKLALGGFVMFHYDGDTVWSDRAQARTPAQFEREVRVKVQQQLNKVDPSKVEDLMLRLIEVTPHYSVEAWTYQATDHSIALCRSKHSGRDIDKFEEWSRDRAALDEVIKPKDQTCLGNQHNEELAKRVPCKDVLAIGKSFAELMRRLRQCPELAALVRPELSI